MVKIFLRFITLMVFFSTIYLIYINSSYTSLQQLTGKRLISVKIQNLPELILPSKEEHVGYQYELLKSFLDSIGKDDIEFGILNNDVEIFYSKQKCNKCVVINDQDLLLVSNTSDKKSNSIEFLNIYENIDIDAIIKGEYKISFSEDNIDDHIFNLSNNLISFSILTRSTYLFYKKYYPNLKIVKKISNINLVWRFPKDDGSIAKELLKYLESDNGIAITQRLTNKYYSRDTMSSYIFIGSKLFISDIITKLPEFENIFKRTAVKYNIDWKLLAAISYQESKWNNNSISPTGVRGLMMLTEKTAEMLGVDRLNINQSIDGGARYILDLKNRFKDYKQQTTLNLALAAYNVGPGHIEDVITLAKKDKININEWRNLKTYLLRLNKKKFYKKMKYGYARGWEATQYVENVKQYYDILSFLGDKDDEYKNNIPYEVPKTL